MVWANCDVGKTCHGEFEKTRFDFLGYDHIGFGTLSCPVCRSEVYDKVGLASYFWGCGILTGQIDQGVSWLMMRGVHLNYSWRGTGDLFDLGNVAQIENSIHDQIIHDRSRSLDRKLNFIPFMVAQLPLQLLEM